MHKLIDKCGCNRWIRRLRKNRNTLLVACLALVPITGIAAHDVVFNVNDNWITGDFDLSNPDRYRHIGSRGSPFGYAQQFSESYSETKRIDDDAMRAFETEYALAGTYRFGSAWEFNGAFEFVVDKQLEQASTKRLQLHQLNAVLNSPSGRGSLAFGRQAVADERTWLFDAEFDAISYLWRGEKRAVALLIGNNSLLDDPLFESGQEDDEDEGFDSTLVYLRYYARLSEDIQGSIYTAYFDNKNDDESNHYAGLRALGHFSDTLSFWFETAVSGSDRDGRLGIGQALDVGLLADFHETPLNPTISLGFAHARGDDGLGSDSTFRQSGFHSNEAVLGGVSEVKYYGHSLDPELSNLQVLTFGAGIRPADRWSVELLYHRYWQVTATPALEGTSLDAVPDGQDRLLGSALDLTLAWRQWSHLSISAVLGRFVPDGALSEGVDPVTTAEIEFQLNF